MTAEILQGDVIEQLRTLPSESVHCVITSPPYHQLRSYLDNDHPEKVQELGLEPTFEEYLSRMVGVFREVRRVLRKDGVCFVNMGSSYACAPNGRPAEDVENDDRTFRNKPASSAVGGFKPKDLIMQPQLLAEALRAPYTKPNKIRLERDRAWLAAFIDGEGCIGIRQQAGHSRTGIKCQDGFVPYVTAGNQDKELLDYCHAITGCGRVGLKSYAGTDKRGINTRRDSYGWRVESLACIEILIDVYPFLIAKRKQAVLAYNLALSNQDGKDLRGKGPLPAAEQEKRQYLKSLINQCNQRQPVDVPSWCKEPKQHVEPGWWLRSAMPWVKRSAMPESCTDRPSTALEYVFVLAKNSTYFWDCDAVRRGHTAESIARTGRNWDGKRARGSTQNPQTLDITKMCHPNGRNLRNADFYWDSLDLALEQARAELAHLEHIRERGGLLLSEEGEPLALDVNTEATTVQHFASFPRKLVAPLVQAGTSERGVCAECGSPWRRVVEKEFVKQANRNPTRKAIQEGKRGVAMGDVNNQEAMGYTKSHTLGWQPSCKCQCDATVPATVLDPFAGTGTTLFVAMELGRRAIGIELSEKYVEICKRRLRRAQLPLDLVG